MYLQTEPRVWCCFRATIPVSFWERKKATQRCHRRMTVAPGRGQRHCCSHTALTSPCVRDQSSALKQLRASNADAAHPLPSPPGLSVHISSRNNMISHTTWTTMISCLWHIICHPFSHFFFFPTFNSLFFLFRSIIPPSRGQGGIFSSYPELQLCITFLTGYSHITYWSSQMPFSSCNWHSDPAQGHKMEKIIMSFGIWPRAEGSLPTNMFLTWVQMLSVQWGQKLHITHALSSLPTRCQCWWYYPQQDQLWQGEFTPAIVRGLAVISLQNCFPRCTRDITNG